MKADVVIQFVASTTSVSKQDARNKAQAALDEYNQLLNTLRNAGLLAAGKQGNSPGEVLIIVACPWEKLTGLIEQERHSDFLHGLLTNAYPGENRDFSASPLNPADRIRLIHSLITTSPAQGGLGIDVGSDKWPRVKSVFILHDRAFNHTWISNWTKRQIGFHISANELDVVKEQFGEAVALYYSFLSSYARALVFPAIVGIAFWKFENPYSPIYSILVVIWSVIFVEWWRIRERKLSVRWGTRGAAKVEKIRIEYHPTRHSDNEDDDDGFPWWKREFRILTSLPVIGTAAVILAALLTGIFVLEAFVTQLYTGPGHQLASLVPTILFAGLVPQFLAVYQKIASRLTDWENHAHASTHDASLTIKTFALSSIVAYLGLSLSAFVYVPFGEYIMTTVHTFMLKEATKPDDNKADAKAHEKAAKVEPLVADTSAIASKINASRLQNQMFAYTVTNQIINTFLEVGLPFIMRGVGNVRNGKGLKGHKTPTTNANAEDDAFLEDVRHQATLPQYSLFTDYSEMVTQFGYVALYSTIWPLAPAMALINDWLELRSDAFKMTTHTRRPIPARVDTIGPWLENLSFIAWLSALTNSALVYLFRPSISDGLFASIFHQHTPRAKGSPLETLETSVVPAILIALSASHGYIILRALTRHLLERALWKGSREAREGEKKERIVKQTYLKGVASSQAPTAGKEKRSEAGSESLWTDDGKAELEKWIKTD